MASSTEGPVGVAATAVRPTGQAGLGHSFRLLWAGQSASLVGDQITLLALPLLAVTHAEASVFQVGLVTVALRLPFLLLGLPAGVWVTRYGLLPSMVTADLLRGAALLILPAIMLVGRSGLPMILAVSLAIGVGSVFFQVSYQAFVPEIVEDPGRWHAANTRLTLSESMSLLVGPALGGSLIVAVSIAGALLFDVGSFAISVVTLLLIGRRHHLLAPHGRGAVRSAGRMIHQILEGLRYVRRQPVLHALMWTGMSYNLGAAMVESLLVLFAVRDLALSPAALGLAIGIGGIGFPIGSLISRPINRRIGMGAALILAAVPSVGGFLVAGAATGPAPEIFLSLGIGLVGLGQGCFAVNAITLRQQTSAPEMRARTTSVHRFATWGTLPIGALLGGTAGEVLGVRPAIFCAFLLSSLCFWPLLASPLRQTRGTTW